MYGTYQVVTLMLPWMDVDSGDEWLELEPHPKRARVDVGSGGGGSSGGGLDELAVRVDEAAGELSD